MKIIVGLGNPGKKYKKTRHNLGFRVIDEFARKNNFPEFKLSKKFIALVSENLFNNEKIILAKPQTFMNESGKAVRTLANFYKITRPGRVVDFAVVHDDIDLPLGKIRIIENRGAAGHKGVKSIIKELGTKNFVRFRVGIQPKNRKPKNVEKFVLQKFTKDEEKIIKEVIKNIVEAIETIITESLEKVMDEYNRR